MESSSVYGMTEWYAVYIWECILQVAAATAVKNELKQQQQQRKTNKYKLARILHV